MEHQYAKLARGGGKTIFVRKGFQVYGGELWVSFWIFFVYISVLKVTSLEEAIVICKDAIDIFPKFQISCKDQCVIIQHYANFKQILHECFKW